MSENKEFKCKECGSCCAGVLPLSNEEIEKIKKYIKENNIKANNSNNIFSKNFQDICPFLNKDNKCNIYEVRPEICRWFRCDIRGKNTTYFRHLGKRFVNILLEFYPNEYCCNPPDLTKLNKKYGEEKRRIKNNNSYANNFINH